VSAEFNIVYQQVIATKTNVCTTVFARSAVTGPDSSQVLKYHAADKHDTPSSHLKPTLSQPALLKALNGEC